MNTSSDHPHPWEVRLDTDIVGAETVVDLVRNTAKMMDEWITEAIPFIWFDRDILSLHSNALRWDEGFRCAIQEAGFNADTLNSEQRFQVVVKKTEIMDDIEYGGRYYFGILAHAYRLHSMLPTTPEIALKAEVMHVAQAICEVDDSDYPPDFFQNINNLPDDTSEECPLGTEQDAFEFVRICFHNALAYAHGWHEAQIGVDDDADEPVVTSHQPDVTLTRSCGISSLATDSPTPVEHIDK